MLLVEVESEVEVDEVLSDVELVLELVELVDDDVLEVLVLEVDVLLVLLEVELVLVDDVEVLVVTLSRGSNSPTANLYTRPTTPADALERLGWLIALMYGSIARDSSFNCPVLSLYPHTPVVCNQIVQEPIF